MSHVSLFPPKSVPPGRGSGPHLIRSFRDLRRAHTPHLDLSSRFCKARGRDQDTHRDREKEIDRPRYSICSNRPHSTHCSVRGQGSNLTADGCVYRECHCDMQFWARAAHLYCSALVKSAFHPSGVAKSSTSFVAVWQCYVVNYYTRI